MLNPNASSVGMHMSRSLPDNEFGKPGQELLEHREMTVISKVTPEGEYKRACKAERGGARRS